MDFKQAVGALFFLVLLNAVPPALAQGPLLAAGQSQIDTTAPPLVIGGPSGQELAQVYTSSRSGPVGHIRLPVYCDAGSDLVLELRADVIGSPAPEGPVLASLTVAGALLPRPAEAEFLRTLRLPTPVPTGETGEYAIVLKSTGTCWVLRGPDEEFGNNYRSLYSNQTVGGQGWQCFCSPSFSLAFFVFQDLLSLPSDLRNRPEAEQHAWAAAATRAQLPGALPGGTLTRFPIGRIRASLWINDFGDAATLQFNDGASAGASRIALRCAAAGEVGPVLWSTGPEDRPEAEFTVLTRDLVAASSSVACPTGISNVASMSGAAAARLLYLEVESGGTTYRGQFWPREVGERGVAATAGVSEQQVVGGSHGWARANVTLSFAPASRAEGDEVGYVIPNRHRFGSVALHCAPPGTDGDMIVSLFAQEYTFANEDIIPTSAASPCGMAVNNTASLLEALQRGLLYVVIERIDLPGVRMRGQFTMF